MIVVLGIALGACDVRKSTRCALTNIDTGLRARDAETLGWAAECALAQSPASLASHVPALLKHLGDTRVYRVVQSGGGLIGFGEAGPRELSVGQMAMRAVETAAPTAANIEPIVTTMVAALNAMKSTERLGLYGEPATTATALMQVLAYKYHPAGLGSAVAPVLRAALPQVRNTVITNDAWRMAALEALARGEVRDPYAALQQPAVANNPAPPPAMGKGQLGLTWGLLSAASQRFAAHCHGMPKSPMDQLHRGSCKPYHGDTLCTARLPILCFAPSHQALAISAPTPGTDLRSRAVANAICARAFGPDWRMAEHHDGDWGIEATGRPPMQSTRFWAAISDQNGNCWDR